MSVNKYSFDTSHFDFLELVKSHLCKTPKFKNLTSLQDIHRYSNHSDLSLLEQLIYELFHTDQFQKLYDEFSNKMLNPIFGNNYGIQRIPSVRIAYPEAKSVNFHNDCWYGHGDEIINVWIPLTNVRETQSLAFLSDQENEKALKFFKENEPSLIEIQKYCEERAHFTELDYGQFITFPTKSLHGTFHNKSSEIRISFDLRICLDNNFGSKSKDFFKFKNSSLPLKNENNENSKSDNYAVGYLNQKPIFNDYIISQTIQIDSMIQYCKRQNLKLLIIETELIGFNRPLNLEDIICGNRKGLAKNIVIFSDKLLNRSDNEIGKLFDIAISENYVFHFVNEGYTTKNIIK